jgi:phosphopantetheinyl transferase
LVAGALGLDPADLVIDRHCPRCGAADHGRPTVRGGGIEFSVSSSGRLAAVAVADRPVGVDVELARTGVAPLDAALSPREQDALVGLDGHRRDGALLRLWTAKEAVLKAAGRDLGDDPSRIDVAGLLTTSSVEVGCGGRQWVVRHPALDPSVADQAVVAVADGWGAAVVRRSVDDRPSQDAT